MDVSGLDWISKWAGAMVGRGTGGGRKTYASGGDGADAGDWHTGGVIDALSVR